jgi:protein TonB
MSYPNRRAQSRTLYACFGVSLAVHGLAMVAFPGLRPADPLEEAPPLSALFASGTRADSLVPAPPPKRPRRQQAVEPVKTFEPAPAAAPSTPEPAPAPSAGPPIAAVAAEPAPAEAAARDSPEVPDASLLEAYRLALIDAAKRYKRYPMQAMERGWEGRVEIRVVVGANGMIKSALVKRSSRYQVLDDQALDMVRRAFNALAQDRPAPRGREFSVDVPVIFELQTG